MIAVKLEGRMGNQLFQYAFIYSAAKKLNTRFYLDKSVNYLLLDKYFNIENDFCRLLDDKIFSVKGFKNFFSHYFRWAFYYLLRHLSLLKDETFSNNIPPSAQLYKLADNRMYMGNFQSETYFSEYKADIKKLFSVKDTHAQKFEAIFRRLPKAEKYITVHIRRGDYLSHNWALNIAYYHNAIKSIHQEENYYIFISDDPGFVKAEFSYLANKYVSENDEITDFQFLTHADTCILSNSSFSWWGAWLNTNPHKQVLAPMYWLGQKYEIEYPVGISDRVNLKWIQQ